MHACVRACVRVGGQGGGAGRLATGAVGQRARELPTARLIEHKIRSEQTWRSHWGSSADLQVTPVL